MLIHKVSDDVVILIVEESGSFVSGLQEDHDYIRSCLCKKFLQI